MTFGVGIGTSDCNKNKPFSSVNKDGVEWHAPVGHAGGSIGVPLANVTGPKPPIGSEARGIFIEARAFLAALDDRGAMEADLSPGWACGVPIDRYPASRTSVNSTLRQPCFFRDLDTLSTFPEFINEEDGDIRTGSVDLLEDLRFGAAIADHELDGGSVWENVHEDGEEIGVGEDPYTLWFI